MEFQPFYPTQKVVCIADFEDVRKAYGFNYPKLGDVLTIKKCYKNHPSAKVWMCNLIENVFQPLSHEFFAPMEEKFQSITLSKVLEVETPLISVN